MQDSPPRPPMPAEVAAAFAAAPDPLRPALLDLRRLIFSAAAGIDGVGPLTETLKWGEPAYLTEASRAGSTIRIGWASGQPPPADRFGLYVNCRTTLLDSYRRLFPDQLVYEGARGIILSAARPSPEAPLLACIGLALTYHRDKRRAR